MELSLIIAFLLYGIVCLVPTDYIANEKIQLIPEYSEYAVGVESICFSLINKSDEEIRYGSLFIHMLVKKDGNERHIIPLDRSAAYYLRVLPSPENTFTIEIKKLYGVLSEGKYTLEMVFSRQGERYTILGEFNIVAGLISADYIANENFVPIDYIVDEKIQLILEYSEYAVGVESISFLLINNSSEGFRYGSLYGQALLKKDGNEWHVIPHDRGVAYYLMALPAQTERTFTIAIKELYGVLSEGKYAFKMDFSNRQGEIYIVLGKFSIVSAYYYE